MEELSPQPRRQMVSTADTPRRLAKDGDVIGVTTEMADIVPGPF